MHKKSPKLNLIGQQSVLHYISYLLGTLACGEVMVTLRIYFWTEFLANGNAQMLS